MLRRVMPMSVQGSELFTKDCGEKWAILTYQKSRGCVQKAEENKQRGL